MVPYTFWISTPYQIHGLQLFSPIPLGRLSVTSQKVDKDLPLAWLGTAPPPPLHRLTEMRPCLVPSHLSPGPQGWDEEVIPAWRVGTTTASSSPHRLQFRVKKEGWGGGGTRSVTFSRGSGDVAVLKASGKALTVSVGDGLPKSSSESAQNQEIGAQEAGPVGGGIRDRGQSKS